MTTALPASLTPEKADALAATLAPSWHAIFGDPTALGAGSGDGRIANRVVAVEGVDTPVSARTPASPAGKPQSSKRPVASTKAARALSAQAAPASVDLPTEGGSMGKMIGGALAVAALIALYFVFSGGSDAPGDQAPVKAGDTKAVAQPQQPPKPAAAPPKPAAAPEATTPEPPPRVAVEPKVEPPAPVVAPPPPAKPQTAPKPATAPKPQTAPKPAPAPKPTGGGIVRDVPF